MTRVAEAIAIETENDPVIGVDFTISLKIPMITNLQNTQYE
jgi:hypothetical protein